MANIQANIKRHDQDARKHIQIHSQIAAMKTQIKKTQKTKSKKDLSLAYKIIDSALSKGIIKKNKADRLKSRLTLFVNDEKRFVAIETKKVFKKSESKKPKIEKTIKAKSTANTEQKTPTSKSEIKSETQKSTATNTKVQQKTDSEKHHHAATKKIVLKSKKPEHNTHHASSSSTTKKTKISTKQKPTKK